MANKPITDATAVTTMAATDTAFVKQGGDLKQITLNNLVKNAEVMTDAEFNTLWSEITA